MNHKTRQMVSRIIVILLVVAMVAGILVSFL